MKSRLRSAFFIHKHVIIIKIMHILIDKQYQQFNSNSSFSIIYRKKFDQIINNTYFYLIFDSTFK